MATHSRLQAFRYLVVRQFALVFLSSITVAGGDDSLDALVEDYRSYGLPMPHECAELSLLRWKTNVVNDIPQYREAIAFIEKSGDEEAPDRYWFGCRRYKVGEQLDATPIEPKRTSIANTQRIDSIRRPVGFATYPEVALAIQFAARGWDDLAQGILERSRCGPQRPFDDSPMRPLQDRAAVAKLAWNHWCNEFAYDFLIRTGRGKCVDRAHVLHCWSRLQQSEARDYLVTNALTENDDGEIVPHEALLHALGSRYPADLVKLFDENVARLENPYDLFEALGRSAADDKTKSRLFLREATGGALASTRKYALRQLLKMKHVQAVPLLVDELAAIPRTPKQPYWQSTAGGFALLVCLTDDSRAWAALLKNARRVDVGQRLEIIQAVGSQSNRKDDQVVGFLASFLNDQERRPAFRVPQTRNLSDPKQLLASLADDLFGGPSAGFTLGRVSVRDFAALELAGKLGVEAGADSSWKDAQWQDLRDRIQGILNKRMPVRKGSSAPQEIP